jgi:folate-binding protein YgfZ
MVDDPSRGVAIPWTRLAARGSEARSFMDSQLTQDLASVGEAGGWTLLLQPDSVVVCAGWVTTPADGVDLVVPTESAPAARARLTRFLLRIDCRIEEVGVVTGPFADDAALIDAPWPGPHEFARALTPHAFGARVVAEAVSFTKGCYTGQELVGRLDARGGQVPWRVVRVSGASPDALDEGLRSVGPDGPSGLTTWVEGDGGVRGLGVAHRTALTRHLEGVATLEPL